MLVHVNDLFVHLLPLSLMTYRVLSFQVLVELSVKELLQWVRCIFYGCRVTIGTEVIVYDVYRFLKFSHLEIQLLLLELLKIIKSLLAWCQRIDLAVNEGIRILEMGTQNLLEDVVDCLGVSILILRNGYFYCLGEINVLFLGRVNLRVTQILVLNLCLIDKFRFKDDHAVIVDGNMHRLVLMIHQDG